MRREMLVGMLVMLSLMGAGQARLPQVNDTVVIVLANGHKDLVYEGNITEITDSFIGLNATSFQSEDINGDIKKETLSPPFPVCLGVGSITTIIWE